jgi:hypothetical protein
MVRHKVRHKIRHTLVAASMAATLGCSAEFGGRCTTAAECSADRVCLQGYCLPPKAQGPDDGVPDDGGATDRGADDGGRFDSALSGDDGGGPDADLMIPLCAPGADGIPAYDANRGHRACPDAHTIALWRFDDGFTALGRDGNAGPALEGDPDRDAVQIVDPGLGEGSARFTGQRDPRFEVTDDDMLRNAAPMTVELWVLIEGFVGADRSLVGNLDVTGGGRGGWEVFVRAIEGQGYAFGAAVPVLGGGPMAPDDATTDLVADDRIVPPGRWTHVALVVGPDPNEQQVTFYIDGVASARTGIALLRGAGGAFRLGARRNLDTHYFQGRLDEVRLSDVAREVEDIQKAVMNRPL